VKYGEKLATRLVGEGCGFVYIPHEHPYIPLGIGKHLPWAVLLQTTPVVGSLAIEDGSGFTPWRCGTSTRRLAISDRCWRRAGAR
jgi:hypothetical protein